jgi:predicted O-linked N-acetylglucosamine transferase (SPINDLY family)
VGEEMISSASEKAIPTLDAAFDLYESGDPNGAATLCASLLAADEGNYGALYLLGSIFGELGDHHNAILHLRRAIALKPDRPLAHFNLAHVLNRSHCPDDALPAIESYIAIIPDNPEAHVLRAVICSKLKRFEEAARSSAHAIELQSNFAEAYNVRGGALENLGRVDEALSCYDKAIALKPNYAEAYSNRGNALENRMRLDEALASYAKAIALKPDFADAYRNRAGVYRKLKRFNETFVAYKQALALDPELAYLLGDLVHVKQKLCDWSSFDVFCRKISEGIQNGKKISTPFPLLSLPLSLALQKQATVEFVHSEYPADPDARKNFLRKRHEKIRLGYFSMDFRNHPVSALTAELYEKHDRSKFEVIAFSFGPKTDDAMYRRLQNGFDHFFDVNALSERDIAKLAREKEIDIAIDLAGFTENSRTRLFAFRAAPIQISYIGYLGTMGAEYMDYIIADDVIIPNDLRHYYTEKVIYLPSYQANDTQRGISDRPITRTEFGLPEAAFVFCCFNNNYKLTPETFDSWIRVLESVPHAVLWLFVDNEDAKGNLTREAKQRGLDPKRLIFADRAPNEEYLARYRLADLFLDTLPYNAGTTASDALWSGLPVLTQIGETFAGRVAASVLTAIGLPELITETSRSYESMAIQLATRPEMLRRIGRKLAANRLTHPLFDIDRFTRHIEAAYQVVHDRHQSGMPPDHVFIDA